MTWHTASQGILDFGWLFFLLMLLHHFWRDRQSLARAKDWLKTKGQITHCEWTQEGHSIWPKIEYVYEVHNQELIGRYLFLDTTHNSPNSKYARQVAYNIAIAYQEHKDIEVYYNPNQPEQSALDITMPTKLNVILILIAAVTILQVGIIFSHWW